MLGSVQPYSAAVHGAHLEQRAHPRLPLSSILLWDGGVAHPGRGDVSVGGCLWKGAHDPGDRERIQVSFRLPGTDRDLRVWGTVLRQREAAGLHGVHLKFSPLPRELTDAIAAYSDRWFDIADASGLLGL